MTESSDGRGKIPPDKNLDSNSMQLINKDFMDRVSKNRFRPDDKGPFFLFVEGIETKVGKTHPMVFGRWLFGQPNIDKKLITNVVRVGGNRMKVELISSKAANDLIETVCFESKKMFAYIPDTLVYKTGVIRHVDPSLTDEEILLEMNSPIPPIRVKRLAKTTINPDGTRTNTKLQTCVLTFDSQRIPEFVSIYGARCRVDTYVPPVRQCSLCYRIGHVKFQCVSGIRCLHCAEQHASDDCPKERRSLHCINCNSTSHAANSKMCPIYTESQKKKKEQVLADSYAIVTRNSFGILTETTEPDKIETYEVEEFPPIRQVTQERRSSTRRPTRSLPYQRPSNRKKPNSAEYAEERQRVNPPQERETIREKRQPLDTSRSYSDNRRSESPHNMDIDQETLVNDASEAIYKLMSQPASQREVSQPLFNILNNLISRRSDHPPDDRS